MDKRVILAVSGSGKTQYIIERLHENSRTLIVTYTINNTKNLKKRIMEKFGFIPKGIKVYTYFSFITTFCVYPIVDNSIKLKGITYSKPSKYTSKKNQLYYIDSHNRLYHNRIAKYILDCGDISLVLERIEKYFDSLYIDEMQDLAGNDFNFLIALFCTNVEILLVGDFFQHTFDTSRDGNTQQSLYKDLNGYIGKLKDAGFTVDKEALSHSYRCGPTICRFVSDDIGIPIKSHRIDEVKIALIENNNDIKTLMRNDSVVKLFFKESHKYIGWTDNWGNTKGLDDFYNVCVVLNKTTFIAYKKGRLKDLAPFTKNKLYVACTRTKGNLFFVPENLLEKYKR